MNVVKQISVLLLLSITIGCGPLTKSVNCNKKFIVTMNNNKSEELLVVFVDKHSSSSWDIKIENDSMILPVDSMITNSISYSATGNRECCYTEMYYQMDHWVVAKIYNRDTVLVNTIDLYPWNIKFNDAECDGGDNPQEYRDTISLK